MSHLYNVYYRHTQGADVNVSLPAPSAEIEYVENTNWDHHTKYVAIEDGKAVWRDGLPLRLVADLIATTANTEILVATNEGTFGVNDALAVTGSANIHAAMYKVYKRLGDGHQRVEGYPADKAPGYLRFVNGPEWDAQTAKLATLRAELADRCAIAKEVR